jgi:hypothetical protein
MEFNMHDLTVHLLRSTQVAEDGMARATLRWLKSIVQRIWLGACAHAERPERIVPYY